MGEMTPEQTETALEAMLKAFGVKDWDANDPIAHNMLDALGALAAAGFLRAPGPPTDEEVERAMVAFSRDYRGSFREDIRAALTVALRSIAGEEG